MGKVRCLTEGASPNDPLFVTLFPNPENGSVTVVGPPVMVELDPQYRREIYANCIAALEEMVQKLSYAAARARPSGDTVTSTSPMPSTWYCRTSPHQQSQS